MSAGGRGERGDGVVLGAAQALPVVRCARGLTAWPWPGPACSKSLPRETAQLQREGGGGGGLGGTGWAGGGVGGRPCHLGVSHLCQRRSLGVRTRLERPRGSRKVTTYLGGGEGGGWGGGGREARSGSGAGITARLPWSRRNVR